MAETLGTGVQGCVRLGRLYAIRATKKKTIVKKRTDQGPRNMLVSNITTDLMSM